MKTILVGEKKPFETLCFHMDAGEITLPIRGVDITQIGWENEMGSNYSR